MQADAIRDVASTALSDRAWQRSLGASCLLHGAVVAALLMTWHIQPKPAPLLRPIPVTLVHTADTAPDRAVQPAQATPEPPAPREEAAAAPAPPVAAARKAP